MTDRKQGEGQIEIKTAYYIAATNPKSLRDIGREDLCRDDDREDRGDDRSPQNGK